MPPFAGMKPLSFACRLLALKTEAVCSSETSLHFYRSIRMYTPEYISLQEISWPDKQLSVGEQTQSNLCTCLHVPRSVSWVKPVTVLPSSCPSVCHRITRNIIDLFRSNKKYPSIVIMKHCRMHCALLHAYIVAMPVKAPWGRSSGYHSKLIPNIL
jgi:hypothetical protein